MSVLVPRNVSYIFLAVAAIFAIYAAPAIGTQKAIILATTTSTQDSGLLDKLIPIFEKRSGYQVKTIAVGSGQAMAMGRRGEADVLLVHSPEDEKRFMEEGYGSKRHLVMHNDFIIVGPADDPAGAKGAKSSVDAFRRIAEMRQLFLSRGDNSGTHVKEKKLWKEAGGKIDSERWYQQTGLGMGETLNVASEKRAYTLTDRATYLVLKRNLGLKILFEGDKSLMNIYHVIVVNKDRWPKVNAAGAKAFADFLLDKEIQKYIGMFGYDKFGAALFFPDAGKNPEALGR